MRRILTVSIVVLLAALSVAAQGEMRPVSYLAEFRVKPGQESTIVDLVKKYDKPVFDRLVAEGTVVAWGLDAKMVHNEGGTTHMFWWVTADFAGQDKVFAALFGIQMADADEKAFQDAIVPEKHHDHILRTQLINIKEEEPAGPVYTRYSFTKVKPGKGDEWEDLWKTYTQPIYEKLMADGSIFGYGIDAEWIHTEDPGWRAVWVVTTSLAAFDKIDAGFRAAFEARSEAERDAIGTRFRSLVEPSEHRDSLWRSVSLQ